MRDIVTSGEIGTLCYINARRYRDSAHVAAYGDIDPVLMTMIHDIDLALWCDGTTAASAVAWRSDAASMTAAQLTSHSGACWDLRTGWLHPGIPPEDRLEVMGTNGSVELVAGSQLMIHAAESRRIYTDSDPDPLQAELACFIASIQVGRLLAPVTARDALDGLRAAEMIIAALER